jgi:hypothetical protein
MLLNFVFITNISDINVEKPQKMILILSIDKFFLYLDSIYEVIKQIHIEI